MVATREKVPSHAFTTRPFFLSSQPAPRWYPGPGVAPWQLPHPQRQQVERDQVDPRESSSIATAHVLLYSPRPQITANATKPAHTHRCPTCPVVFFFTQVNPIAANVAKPVQTGCADNDPMCREWMVAGECDKNPAFMHTSCRKACKMCFTNGAHASAAGLPNA